MPTETEAGIQYLIVYRGAEGKQKVFATAYTQAQKRDATALCVKLYGVQCNARVVRASDVPLESE